MRVGVRAAWSVMYVRSRSNPSCCRRCFCFDTRRRATHVMERRRATASGDVLRTSGEPQSSTARIMVHSYRSCYIAALLRGDARDGQQRASQRRLDRRLQSDPVVGDQQSSEHSLVQGKLRCPRKYGVLYLLLFVGHASLLTTLTAASSLLLASSSSVASALTAAALSAALVSASLQTPDHAATFTSATFTATVIAVGTSCAAAAVAPAASAASSVAAAAQLPSRAATRCATAATAASGLVAASATAASATRCAVSATAAWVASVAIGTSTVRAASCAAASVGSACEPCAIGTS